MVSPRIAATARGLGIALSSHYAATARHDAATILSRPPYRPRASHVPRPLRGLFTDIGHGLHFVFGGFIGWLYHHVVVHIGHGVHAAFGNWWPVPVLLAAVAVGVGAGSLVWRRRARVDRDRRDEQFARTRRDSPDDLERVADLALAAADYESAVRLYFQSGVARLTERGVVANGVTRTDQQLSREVDSATFDDVLRRHERIVYGRQRASEADAVAARDAWVSVLRDVRRRHEPTLIESPA